MNIRQWRICGMGVYHPRDQILYTIQQHVNNDMNVPICILTISTFFIFLYREKNLYTLLKRCLTEHDNTQTILFAVPELPAIV